MLLSKRNLQFLSLGIVPYETLLVFYLVVYLRFMFCPANPVTFEETTYPFVVAALQVTQQVVRVIKQLAFFRHTQLSTTLASCHALHLDIEQISNNRNGIVIIIVGFSINLPTTNIRNISNDEIWLADILNQRRTIWRYHGQFTNRHLVFLAIQLGMKKESIHRKNTAECILIKNRLEIVV